MSSPMWASLLDKIARLYSSSSKFKRPTEALPKTSASVCKPLTSPPQARFRAVRCNLKACTSALDVLEPASILSQSSLCHWKTSELPMNRAALNAVRKATAGLTPANTLGLRWRVFDAQGQILGRLASQIAVVLQGKDKPTYTPYLDSGDVCIVLNAKEIALSGNKLTDKFYRWHTGYIGHLKERSVKEQMNRDPTEVIRKAVLRMLPRNKLRDDRALKLRIFPDAVHPFDDKPLETFQMPPRKVREMRPRERRAAARAQKPPKVYSRQ